MAIEERVDAADGGNQRRDRCFTRACIPSSFFSSFSGEGELAVAEHQTLIRLALASGRGEGARENIYRASFDRIERRAFRMIDREIRAWKIREQHADANEREDKWNSSGIPRDCGE